MPGPNGNTRKEIIIDFSILNQDAIKNIQTLQTKIANLKRQNELLAESGQKNSETYIKNTLAIKDYTKVLKANEKELQNEIQAQREDGDSLNAMRAQLRNLIAAYSDLSKAERESALGDDYIKQIDELSTSIEKQEELMHIHSRTVGDYNKIWNNMPGPIGRIKKGFDELSGGTGQLSVALANGGKAVKAFSVQLLKLMMNPIVALIAAIVASLKLLVDQFKKNDEAMTSLQSLFAAFKPLLDIINKGFQALASTVGKAAGAVAGFVTKVASFIPGIKDYVEAEQDMVKSTDELQEAKRQYTMDEAKRQKQIAELNNKAAQSDKYTFTERKEFMEQAIKLEKEGMEQKRANAQEELRLAQQEAALAVGAAEYSEELWNRLSDEVKDNLTQLTAAVDTVEAEYSQGTRRMESRRSQFYKQEAAEWRAYRKNRRDAEFELQDELLKNYQDSLAAQWAKFKATTNKEIAELQDRLNNADEKLDSKTRQAIKERITLLQNSFKTVQKGMLTAFNQNQMSKAFEDMVRMYQSVYDTTIDKTEERYNAETKLLAAKFEQEQNMYQQNIDNIQERLRQISDDESVDEATMRKRAELAGLTIENYKIMLDQQKNLLSAELNDEIQLKSNAAKKFHNDEIIREQQHQEELRKIRENVASQIMENDIQKRLNEAEIEDERVKQQIIAQIQEDAAKNRLEIAENEYKRLQDLNEQDIELQYGTREAYTLALEQQYGKVLKAEGDYQNAIKATTQAVLNQQTQTINTYKQIANSISSAMGSMQSMFEAMAEDNSEMADFATALAIMQIEVSTAVAIVEAIAAATKAGSAFGVLAPAMIPAFIAELVGIVMANIASTVTTLKKAKSEKPSVPKFYTGGSVDKGKSGVDKVPAMLTKGEYVISKPVVDRVGLDFLNALNFGKLRVPFNTTGHYATGGIVQGSVDMDYSQMKDVMKEAFTESLEAMPMPILDVREVTNVQNRVKIKEQISR